MQKVDRSFMLSLLETAVEAGSAILQIYTTDFNVSFKADQSPLTLADRRSHDIIASRLSRPPLRRFPLLSEEGRDIPYHERRNWEYFWLVDPLDGTKEFVRKNGEFTVNIALMHRNRPVVGVVYLPVHNTLYYAAEDLGAYRLIQRNGVTRKLSIEDICRAADRLPLRSVASTGRAHASPVTVIASRSHLSDETENFIGRMKKYHGEVKIVSSGSALKFCLIAEGSADIYPRFAPTMEWDTAAGQVIVDEAGGKVFTFETLEPLRYNRKDLRNPWFVVIGTEYLHAHGISDVFTNSRP